MVRIAYIIDTISNDTAGTQKQLLQLITKLDKHKYCIFLVCLRESKWMQLNRLPCRHVVLDYSGFITLSFPIVVRRLANFVNEMKIDIVQTFFEDSIFVGFFGAKLGKTRPVLLSSRRDMGLGRESQPWYHYLYTLVLPIVNRFFDGILANSNKIKQYAANRERTPIHKFEVIYNGVETPKRSGRVPSLFCDKKADVWIGIVASLTPVKRHDLFISAFSKLLKTTERLIVRVAILGEGWLRNRLEQLARSFQVDEYIHFEGAVKDVPAYLFNVDIGVLCSDREGLSNAILEYMACGLPVVATSVGGNTEIVDRQTGICVPPDDDLALMGALKRLCINRTLRRKLGANGLQKIKSNFSWKQSIFELERYYSMKLTK